MVESTSTHAQEWDYFLSPRGRWVVSRDGRSGRLLATDTAASVRVRELLVPDGIPGIADGIAVLEGGEVHALFPDAILCWTIDEACGDSVEPTVAEVARSADGGLDSAIQVRGVPMWRRRPTGGEEVFRLDVLGGRVLELQEQYNGFVASWGGDERRCLLTPGSHGRWTAESVPVIDPSGSSVVASMHTTKSWDHGWIAVWGVDDIADAIGSRIAVSPKMFYPNGEPYVDDLPDHCRDGKYSAIWDVGFSPDGTLVVLVDASTIHCWTWPNFDFVWRIRRPELRTRLLRTQSASPVVCGAILMGGHLARLALFDGSVIDVSIYDLSTEDAGVAAGALAVSASDGRIVTAFGQIIDPRTGAVHVNIDDVFLSAIAHDVRCIVVESVGDIVNLESDGTRTCLARLESADVRIVAVGPSGEIVLLAVDGVLREFAMESGGLVDTDWVAPSGRMHFEATIGSDGSIDPIPWELIGRSSTRDSAVSNLVATVTAGGEKIVGTQWGEIHGEGWWSKAGRSPITALASDGVVLIAGFDDGSVSVRQEQGTIFEGEVFSAPVRLLLPMLTDRRLLCFDSEGNIVMIEWS